MADYKKRTELCLIAAQETLGAFENIRGAIEPPVPVEDLAAWLGFQVVYLTLVPDEFSAILSSRDKLIGINGRHHRHRRRFSLCHELAHLLLNHPPEAHCQARDIALYNAEADECAAELLMPSRLLRDDDYRTRSLSELARIFDVSEEALARKLLRLDGSSAAIRDPAATYRV
jgi:Zn-dependent peptidase ImmA (M78 family)